MSTAHNLPPTNVSLEAFWELVAANPDKRLEYRDGVVIDRDAMQSPSAAPISHEAFWELVAANPNKRLEYRDGIVAEKVVADNSNHARINANCGTLLRSALHGKCSVFSADMYVQITTGQLYIPDVSVTCIEQPRNIRSILFSPELVVEVISRSIIAFDSFPKQSDYRDCLSITTILEIAQDERHVEVYERESERLWKVCLMRDSESYQLRHFPIVLDLDAIYRGIRLGA